MSTQGRPRAEALAIGIAVFVSGAVLLGLEIAASRVLAPFFGSSLFVWGALIGVVLTGLSLGYWLGGAVADRAPYPGLLVAAIGVGSLLVLAIPVIDERVLAWVVSWDPGPRLDPVVATILLFGAASMVLGGVSPIAVRLRARDVESVGRTAGRLYALSTAGSIAGTFAAAFWLIPELGTDQVLAVGALALAVVAALVAVVERRLLVAVALAALSVGAGIAVVSLAPEAGGTLEGAAAQNWSPVYRLRSERRAPTGDPASALRSQGFKVVFAKDTRYHRLVVADDDTSRFLRFDNSFQSGMYLDDPFRTRFTYTDYLSLGIAYAPGVHRALFIGLGGGSAPKRIWRDFPGMQLRVVELDPDVVGAARRYFSLPSDRRLRVDVDDGRRWLQRHDDRFDLVVIDAFYADAIPFHLTTREFLELLHARLEPGGVVVVNVIGAITGDESRLLRALVRTYASVFPTVRLHPVLFTSDERSDVTRNVILVATDAAAPSEERLADAWAAVRRRTPGAPDLGKAIRDRWDADVPTSDVPLLTDDYAPTDALLLLH